MAFDSEGRKLFSGDSSGTVCVWNVFVTEPVGRPGFLRDWTVLQKIAEKEMEVRGETDSEVGPAALASAERGSGLDLLEFNA